jgi:hypothetical protein
MKSAQTLSLGEGDEFDESKKSTMEYVPLYFSEIPTIQQCLLSKLRLFLLLRYMSSPG